jgi:hypothetical protein
MAAVLTYTVGWCDAPPTDTKGITADVHAAA